MTSNIAKIPESNDLWPKLKAMKQMVFNLGTLEDSQVHQLKIWGFLVFQHLPIKDIELRIDIENKQVLYVLTGKVKDPKNYAKLVANLDLSIHELLGDDWCLSIDQNLFPIYRGERLKTTDQVKEIFETARKKAVEKLVKTANERKRKVNKNRRKNKKSKR